MTSKPEPENPPAILIFNPAINRKLLSIHSDGTVTGDIEDASEAAKVFFKSLRDIIQQSRSAVIEECARVAESFNVTPAFDLPCSPFDRTEAIADAIRALSQESADA